MRIYIHIGVMYVYIPVVMYAYIYTHRFDICVVYI